MNSAMGLKGDWKKAMQLHLGMDVWVWDVDVWWEGFGGFNVITIQNPFDCLNHGSDHVKSVFFWGYYTVYRVFGPTRIRERYSEEANSGLINLSKVLNPSRLQKGRLLLLVGFVYQSSCRYIV